MGERLYAVRGATSVERNSSEEILVATEALMRELMARNELAIDQFVSCIFTATEDLNAEFPALAARRIGFKTKSADGFHGNFTTDWAKTWWRRNCPYPIWRIRIRTIAW